MSFIAKSVSSKSSRGKTFCRVKIVTTTLGINKESVGKWLRGYFRSKWVTEACHRETEHSLGVVRVLVALSGQGVCPQAGWSQ